MQVVRCLPQRTQGRFRKCRVRQYALYGDSGYRRLGTLVREIEVQVVVRKLEERKEEVG
jgi:hypothetical protein